MTYAFKDLASSQNGITTRQVLWSIREAFRQCFAAELLIGDAVIRTIDRCPDGIYGAVDYLGEQADRANINIGTGETEVTQNYAIFVALAPSPDTNAMLDLFDTIDAIVAWLRYQRFQIGGIDEWHGRMGWDADARERKIYTARRLTAISPSGASDVRVQRVEGIPSPNVYAILFDLSVIKPIVQKPSDTDADASVERITLRINRGMGEVIWEE